MLVSSQSRMFGYARKIGSHLQCTPMQVQDRRLFPGLFSIVAGMREKSVVARDNKIYDTKNAKSYDEIPGPRGVYRLPVLGTLFLYKPFTEFTTERTQEMVDGMFEKYGPIVRFYLGRPSVFICEPEDIAEMFRNEGKYPQRTDAISSLVISYSKRNGYKLGLGELEGEEWYTLRAKLNRILLRVDSASYYLKPQNEVADDFVNILGTHKLSAEKLQDLFIKFAAESIGVVCFNARLNLFDDSRTEGPTSETFVSHTKNIFQALHESLMGKSILHSVYKNTTYMKYSNGSEFFRKSALQQIDRAKQEMEEKVKAGTFDPEEPNLMFSMLNEKGMDEEDIQNAMITMYIAGTDSTGKNLQTFFYHLAKNSHVQDKLYDEVRSVVGNDNMITAEAIRNMPYLKACLKETFRLNYPTVLGMSRILPEDVVLHGYHIPKGVCIRACNQRACKINIPDPQRFVPDRWLRAADKTKRSDALHPLASLPFSMGTRSCIGRRFAEQEIYLGVAKVLQKLKIEIAPDSEETTFVYELFVKPKKPINFVFKRRT